VAEPEREIVDHDSATLIAVPVSSGAVNSAPATVVPSVPTPTGERQLLAGRYEILALIGAGGMGTVYRARDLELDDVVALKVIRPELVATPGILDRFRREAKLARRVTHKNVARVFDIGEHAGEKFLTMEFVDGEALSSVIARAGVLPLARALSLGAAVADGLGGAHAAGVVHRDLKPDNVLLARDGRVVITDFGIARALVDALHGGAGSNSVGLLVGTPAYMAPEQVEARADVDARADIYSFGALLYELFTGHRAWPGDSPFAVAAARLLAPPPDPREKRPDLPAACAELVLRCMAREPGERPASIGEVGAALAFLQGPAHGIAATPTPRPVTATLGSVPTPPLHPVGQIGGHAGGQAGGHVEKTVAVLPFRNAGAPDDDYLAEELTDDLLDALSMTTGLRVRARGAVLRFRGVESDPREIGRELGVQVVVEGSVRRARGHVRISARLVSVADGFQIWAKRFDRPEQEVLSINDEVASAIAAALTLDGRAVEARAREAPSNPIAIDLYLRARHEYRKFWPENVVRAVALFEQSLALAPDDPLLLSGLALALARLSFFTGDGVARAREVAHRAVVAAPQLGEAHLAYGSALLQLGDNPAAARALRSAVSQSPGLAEAHAVLGRMLCEAGDVEEGLRRLDAAATLDPDAPLVLPDFGRIYALLGQWDRAEEDLARLQKLGGMSHWTLRSRLALWRRDSAAADTYLAQLPDDDGTLRLPRMLLEILRTGRIPAEMLDLEKMERGLGGVRRRAFMLQLRAEIFGCLNDQEQVLFSIAGSVEAGLIDRLWLERCPLFEQARRDPRYAPLHATVSRRAEAILEAYRAP
jgi:eukaryotic-like serine/threonine-protein kinase